MLTKIGKKAIKRVINLLSMVFKWSYFRMMTWMKKVISQLVKVGSNFKMHLAGLINMSIMKDIVMETQARCTAKHSHDSTCHSNMVIGAVTYNRYIRRTNSNIYQFIDNQYCDSVILRQIATTQEKI